MDELATRFEEHRGHLRAVAYRMLGSLGEAEDAVQEAWLRLGRSDTTAILNLGGWLTTVVAHVSLDMLRSKKSRREEPLDSTAPAASRESAIDPEQEAVLAESVGLALLVILDALDPAERLAFVLHDLFGVSFDEIAGILGRSPAAARQLASRARRRVRGRPSLPAAELARQRGVIDAFLSALRAGDVEALVAVLDPDLVVNADVVAPGAPKQVRGARNWAQGAVAYAQSARFMRPALVNGAAGVVMAPRGRLYSVLQFTLKDDKIAQIEVVAGRARILQLELAVR